MPQIRFRVSPNIYASLTALVRERKLKGGLSDFCGRLITSFVLDSVEFSKLDALSHKLEKLSDAVARIDAAPRGGLTSDQDQRLQLVTQTLVRITKLLESAGGSK